ncbi:MAG: hypothetical protein ACRDT6_25750 [Micromonosporaceae bacterium]
MTSEGSFPRDQEPDEATRQINLGPNAERNLPPRSSDEGAGLPLPETPRKGSQDGVEPPATPDADTSSGDDAAAALGGAAEASPASGDAPGATEPSGDADVPPSSGESADAAPAGKADEP